MDQEKIGKFIKNLRTENNLTQQDLASILGVTYQAVSKWENGKNIPDISVLKQISEEFNININDILTGEKKKKDSIHPSKKFISLIIIIFLVIIIVLVINLLNSNNYEFKTLSTTCEQFNITGSVAYNKTKSSIFISNINYCGGNDTTKYKNIECTLYESDGNTLIKISDCGNEKQKNITLEDYLKDVNFNIDKYKSSCSNFKEAKLYLQINATDYNDKTTSYKVPLKLNENCSD